MSTLSFADVVHQTIHFNRNRSADRLVSQLIDTEWMQRLRDIRQTGNSCLVYMFAEHSRFGHCLGAAYLAIQLMEHLAERSAPQIKPYQDAVAAAALLHDIGHLAPGSHTAFKTWFPNLPDTHEELSTRIIRGRTDVHAVLSGANPELPALASKILDEDPSLPKWTWQIVSGGGWNVDRGNWSVVDSTMAGVSYGKYNIPALIDSLELTDSGELVLGESRLDAMIHFAVSRQAMYRQIYHHRVILAADHLTGAIVKRARDLGSALEFADPHMRAVLAAQNVDQLPLDTIFCMRESWWRYHAARWRESKDHILADLCHRLTNRTLLKTIRVQRHESEAELYAAAQRAVERAGFDPSYYLFKIQSSDMHAGDFQQSIRVRLDNDEYLSLAEADPLYHSMVNESKNSHQRAWFALPAEAKALLGRQR